MKASATTKKVKTMSDQNQRGRVGKELGDQNKARCLQWWAEHPFGRLKECAQDLGLSTVAVSRHAKAIRSERGL